MAKQLVQLTTTQQCTASIKPLDEKGNPATLASSVWTCSDETVATIVPSDDGLSCEIIAGAPGQCRVVCNADAQADKGNRAMVALIQVTVVAGQAKTIDMEVTDPVEQSGSGGEIDNTLPSRPPRPGNALPGGGGSTKPTPPGGQIDNTLPGSPNYPSTGVPPNVAGQPLPGGPPPTAGQPLPPSGGTKPVGEEEGEHIPGAQPKRR